MLITLDDNLALILHDMHSLDNERHREFANLFSDVTTSENPYYGFTHTHVYVMFKKDIKFLDYRTKIAECVISGDEPVSFRMLPLFQSVHYNGDMRIEDACTKLSKASHVNRFYTNACLRSITGYGLCAVYRKHSGHPSDVGSYRSLLFDPPNSHRLLIPYGNCVSFAEIRKDGLGPFVNVLRSGQDWYKGTFNTVNFYVPRYDQYQEFVSQEVPKHLRNDVYVFTIPGLRDDHSVDELYPYFSRLNWSQMI